MRPKAVLLDFYGTVVSDDETALDRIYNQNFALIKENRDVTLNKGINIVPVQPDLCIHTMLAEGC